MIYWHFMWIFIYLNDIVSAYRCIITSIYVRLLNAIASCIIHPAADIASICIWSCMWETNCTQIVVIWRKFSPKYLYHSTFCAKLSPSPCINIPEIIYIHIYINIYIHIMKTYLLFMLSNKLLLYTSFVWLILLIMVSNLLCFTIIYSSP